MTSQTFSVSIGAIGPRVVAVPYEMHPLDRDDVLVQPVIGIAPQRLSTRQAVLLQACDGLRALDEHADNAARRLGCVDLYAVRRDLEQLVNMGLLIGEDGIRNLLSGDVLQAAPLDTLFIRSSGRPRTLARALRSLDGRSAALRRCVVIDDTTSHGPRDAVQACVDEIQRELALELVHFRRERRAGLLEKLTRRSGANPSRLGWFVQGDPDRNDRYGCGMNLALLLSAGCRMLLLDDDASLEAHAADDSPAPVTLTTQHSLRGSLPEAARATGVRYRPELNPVAEHEKLLGRHVLDLPGGHLDLGALCPDDLLALRHGARVRLTGNGVWGDPGTRQPHWLYDQERNVLPGWATEAGYRESLAQRRTARAEPGARLVVQFSLMTTTLTGIDNSDEMPPTLPFGVGEDTAFGELTRFVYPHSVLGLLPWMLHHEPETARNWQRQDAAQPMTHNIGTFFKHRMLELGYAASATSPQARLRALDAAMTDLAEADFENLETELLRQTLQRRAALSRSLAGRLEQFRDWPHVAEDIERMMASNRGAGWHDDDRPEETVASIRQLARRYAEGLDDWHAAWQAARKLGIKELLA